MRKVVLGIIAGAGLLTMTACASSSGGATGSVTSDAPVLKSAYTDCLSDDTDNTLTVADAGHTIIVDTGSESGDVSGVACVMLMLGTPEAIISSVDSTTAMMGVQQADDKGIHYQWSYHPDNGLNMVITSED